MEPTIVVQEVTFDLATNTAYAVRGTDFGVFGGPVPKDGVISPQLIFETIHPDDLGQFADHLEGFQTACVGETSTVVVRFRHASGPFVAVEIRGTLMEATTSGVGRRVRSLLTWVWPAGVSAPSLDPPAAACGCR